MAEGCDCEMEGIERRWKRAVWRVADDEMGTAAYGHGHGRAPDGGRRMIGWGGLRTATGEQRTVADSGAKRATEKKTLFFHRVDRT